MDFDALTRQWDRFGATDPLWAILTDPTRKGNRWEAEAFFATGREEIAAVVERAREHGVPRRWHRGLDFGCGVGRLTQALASYVDLAIGVDVAPSMIEQARRFNSHGERCRYEVNGAPHLRAWPDEHFDVIYTGRVLQHMEPVYAASYVRELVRILSPGGYLSFDLPSEHGFFPADAPASDGIGIDTYRARVTIVELTPARLSPGERISITVEITNQGSRTWTLDETHPLNVGNHWRSEDGVVEIRDDRRAAVPMPWHPGETTRVTIETVAPVTEGRYRLQCDLVEEGRTWFADVGSPLAEIEVIVGDTPAATRATPEPTASESEPVMEMHAIPRREIEQLLHDAGATLLDVTRVHHCGPSWLAYRYDSTR